MQNETYFITVGWAFRVLENGILESAPWSGRKIRHEMWENRTPEALGITGADFGFILEWMQVATGIFRDYAPLPTVEKAKEVVLDPTSPR